MDTSALFAILSGEADAQDLARRLARSETNIVSTGTALEISIVVQRKLEGDGAVRLNSLLDEFDIRTREFDDEQLLIAQRAYQRFGRGTGHPAKLNYGDCFSYALAKSLDVPLLYKGDDFGHTDIRSALTP